MIRFETKRNHADVGGKKTRDLVQLMLSQCRSETGSVPQCLHTSVLHRVSGSKIEFHAESTGFQFFQTAIRASDSDEEDALVRYFKNMFAFVFLVCVCVCVCVRARARTRARVCLRVCVYFFAGCIVCLFCFCLRQNLYIPHPTPPTPHTASSKCTFSKLIFYLFCHTMRHLVSVSTELWSGPLGLLRSQDWQRFPI